ncbi:MAG: PKD domain-containing protein [Bacteroidota bacterium]
MKIFTRLTSAFFLSICFIFNAAAQTADFSASPTSGCSPLVVLFTDKTTGGSSSVIYDWDFGNSITSSYVGNTSTTYLTAGTYTVKLTVKNGPSGTPSVKTTTITVYPSPTVNYTASPISGCPCTDVVFTNSSVANAPGAYTSTWSFGDGYTATTNNTNHLYCTPGKYNIALKVTNSAGCVTTKVDTSKITINEKPLGSFFASKVNLCKIPDSVIFYGTASKGKPPYSFYWDFGDGIGTSSSSNPTYKYLLSGTYTVKLVVTDGNGCKDTVTKVNYINAVPMNSDFTVPSSLCASGVLVPFVNTSTPIPVATRWLWSDGGGTTGLTPSRNFWKGGTYTITMIDSFGPGCIDTAIKNYTVHPKPKPNFSYSPIYPCPAPATITFTNKSTASDSFLWVFGDGTTSKSVSPVHTYTWDSVFTVYLIAKTSFGCSDTFRVRDTTKDFPGGYPNPYFDSSNTPVIVRVHRGDVYIAVDSTAGCLPFVIKPIATMCGRCHLPHNDATPCTWAMPGYPSPPYWNCKYPHPTDWYADSVADPYIIKSLTTCKGDPAIEHPYPIVSYLWNFGDGSPTTTVDSPTHTYTAEGEYWLSVRVTTHNGCSYTDSVIITAGTQSLANFTRTPSEICIHDSVTFTNASSGGITYTWRFGDGGSFTTTKADTTIKHQFNKADTFDVVLSANRFGCKDTMKLPVIVHPPEVRQYVEYFCDSPMKVKFYDTSVASTSVLWRFGDGFTSTNKYAVHKYSAEGTYTVSQIVYNSAYNCWDSTTFPIEIFLPKPFFSTPDTTICLGSSISFTDSARSYFTDWFWYTSTFSQGGISGGFTVKYKDTGRYTVLYVGIDKHGCTDSFKRTSYVLVAKPQMKIIANPLIACAPSTINFTDSSTNTKTAFNVSRTWIWGDASPNYTSTAITASKTYTVPGTYTVKVITTDNIGCIDSTTLVVESRRPVAAFAAELDTFTCIGRPVKFYNSATGTDLTFFWDFGDGGTSTAANPVYSYNTIGTFNVKLVVRDASGCKDSITKIAFVKTTKPKASFHFLDDSVALCPPLFASMVNTSIDGVTYSWDFGNGGSSTAPAPTTPYMDTGFYIIRLVAFNKYGCTDTTYNSARVMGYDGAFKYSPLSGCAPHTVNFEADLINVDVMVWDFADGSTVSAKGNLKTSHTYTKGGAYIPRLILGDGKGCSTSSKGLDTIKVDEVIAVINNTPACIGTPITFDDASHSYFSDYASSEWTFEDGSKSTSKNPIRIYSTVGNYLIKLISTNTNGCIDTVFKTITVNPLPKIKAKDTVICLNDQAVLTATGGASYYWMPDPTLSCSDCNAPTTNSKVPNRYYVIGTDANGCSNQDTLDLGIKTKTTLILAENADVCEKQPTELLASGAQNYTWTPDKYLNNPNIANPVATMESTIIYRVIGTEGSCIPDTAFITVTVHPLPDVNAGPDQKVLAGTAVQLSGSGTNIKDYLWTPSDNLSCADCPNPTAKPLVTTIYTLKATSDFGCSDSDDVKIVIFCDQSQLFLPNSFTPNGDGQNDYFFPQGSGIGKIKSFIVYNRWGQKVFERTNTDANNREQGWNGTFDGNALNSDTYVYTLEATCDNGEIVFWKGDITLVR